MKKSVVLLITLFFISLLSLLILQNLEDTDKFLDEVSYDKNLLQLKLISSNIEKEVLSLVSKNKDHIDKILEITSDTIPLNFRHILVELTLERYYIPPCNINDIKLNKNLDEVCDQDIVLNISYPYEFKSIVTKHIPFTSTQQIDYIIDLYKTKTKDETVDYVKEQFGFLSPDTNTTYLKCYYNMDISSLNASKEFIFRLDDLKVISSKLVLK